LAIHEPRGNLWDVTGEQVAANRRAGDPKAYGQPGVEVKLDEQNDEDDPGWRRKNRDRIDRERGDENEKVRPHGRRNIVGRLWETPIGNRRFIRTAFNGAVCDSA